AIEKKMVELDACEDYSNPALILRRWSILFKKAGHLEFTRIVEVEGFLSEESSAGNSLRLKVYLSKLLDVWTRAKKESVVSLVAHYIHPADPENPSLTGSIQTKVALACTDSGSNMVKCFSDLIDSGTMALLKQWLPCAAHRLHGLGLYKTKRSEKTGIYGHRTAEDGLAQAEEPLKEIDPKEPTEGEDSTNVNNDALLMEAEEGIEQNEPDWGLEGDDEAFRAGVETTGRVTRIQASAKHSIDRVRALISLLRKSTTARDIMNDVREKFPPAAKGGTAYCGDTVTRWNSTLAMIKQILDYKLQYEEFQRSVESTLPPESPVYKVVENCRLSHTDYRVLQAVYDALIPFKLFKLLTG
ncbi:hypothetical protein FOL47_002609, partial [Perkinsus chesapeaki]